MANWVMVLFFLYTIKRIISYTAPEDCEWTALNDNDVSLTCHLERIVASGVLATNFSLIQSQSTSSLTIICDPMYFESHLAPLSFVHLRYLKSLNIYQCKLKYLSKEAFIGLENLRNLSIQTTNNYWKIFSLNMDDNSLDEMQQLAVLNLAYNNLQNFSDALLCELNSLKILNLTHNDLSTILSKDNVSDYEGSRNCAGSLSELDLSFNKINRITPKNLQKLRKLRLLNLAHNNIEDVDAFLFTNFEFLQIIDLSNNMLKKIPAVLFQDSPDLREIYLQDNAIYSIPSGFFSGLQQLLVLNLSSNHLSSNLIHQPFIDLIRLVLLDLRNNELTFINSTLLLSQYSLQMLFLSHNKISFIEDNSFSSLYNLHTIDLSHNHLEYLDAFTLNGLYVLSDLNLAFNNILMIHPDTFKNCSTLEKLSLQSNNLSFIPDSLAALQFLKSLNLENNDISDLYNSSLLLLKQLRYINLSQNKIGNLTSKNFKLLPILKELDLSKNQIYNLQHGVFDDIESLIKVDLSDNFLTDINGLFMNLKVLKHVNVSRNKVQWFDYAVIPVQLEKLDLHSNEIEILGNYYELENTLQLVQIDVSYNYLVDVNGASFPNKIKVIRINNNRISNIHPFTFIAKSNLTYVDISNNKIQNLDINTFRLNQNTLKKPLPQFAISGNPFFCDCNMEWLHHINKPDGSNNFPRIIDFNEVVCKLSFTRPHSYIHLSKSKSSDFLCKYGSHCFALCHCCEFDACDCEMVCPDECTCFSDQTWNTNIVDCSSQGYASIPSVVPMDVTDLYLDGNDISRLSSHAFIGRKNMRTLFLNNSNVHTIDNRTFNGLVNLRILNIENNHLPALYGYEFESLIHLEELYLSGNKITFVANITFQNLKMLSILHLNHNFIKEFQVWNLNWNSRLTSVRLSHNPWICNCDYLELFHEWLHGASFVRDVESIQCRYNETAGLYLTAFNMSSCSQPNYRNYFELTFHLYYIAIPIISLLLIIMILICLCRHNIKVWLYTKYGIRLFKRNTYTAESEKLFDAFVSYCNKDETFVLQFLTPELECGEPSYRLCLRYRDLPLSEYVAEAVTEAIECSQRTIIVLSEHFLRNERCRFELKTAYRESQCNHKHKLLIVVVGKISFKSLDSDAKQCLSNAHIIHWGDKRFWQKVKFIMPNVNPRTVLR
ncbi:toll-like receptor Tollo [Parasteatoda tepidariorum]|uniref:Toll family protein LongTollC n=1 Tax=Parasteatoda tepidariorum TaxID=114398 RepID=A0A173ADY3_PARTP|nr:toll-like receptor Tollo [Parasteatoda tepidariorum]XP_015917705.1 toll-like receptor Tollo [Parasteatoda tepidariorum]XP_042894994.1 toll-like receptor Tollo [Parasteatoda tepidariorum]XP_042894995.1 toll-like receptor Tollo [Parasteatoda tepidariorum]ANG08902.1 toll family protein LongTollC [Parasteatoda tepidariorum]